MKLSKLAALFIFSLAPSPFAVAAIDQQFVPQMTDEVSNVGASNVVDWSQTFTVGVDGNLTGFDIWMDRQSGTSLPLLYDIRSTTIGGVPSESDVGSNILASGTVPASAFQAGGGGAFVTPSTLPHVDIDNVPVHVGDVLALVLRSDEPGPHLGLSYNWYGETNSLQTSYTGGQAFLRTTNTNQLWQQQQLDLVFRTYVAAVPEPSSASLTLVCFFVMGYTVNLRRLVRPK